MSEQKTSGRGRTKGGSRADQKERIVEDIGQTRDQMGATIEAIEDRLSPVRVREQVVDKVHDKADAVRTEVEAKVVEAGERVQRAVDEHAADVGEKVRNGVQDRLEDAGQAVQQGAVRVRQAFEQELGTARRGFEKALHVRSGQRPRASGASGASRVAIALAGVGLLWWLSKRRTAAAQRKLS